jgi:ParB-like chromosome segregation protein Spo0J
MKQETKVEYVKISRLTLNEKNPRNNAKAVPEVMKSIERFGFLVPVVADKKGKVIAGNTRLKAAQALKMEEIPVVWAEGLTEAELNAFALADNKTAEISTWAYETLRQYITDYKLKDIPGYSQAELDGLFKTNVSHLVGSFVDVSKGKVSKDTAVTFVFDPKQFKVVKEYMKTHTKKQASALVAEVLR